MILVKRDNRILKISDDHLQEYLQNGYSEIDEKGKVISEPNVEDEKDLKKANAALKKEIEALKVENEALKAEKPDKQ